MAKIDIDKFICRIYEELKSISDSRHPEGCEDGKLSIVRKALEEQGLRITDDFQLEEISGNQGGISPNDDKSIKVGLGTDLYIPSEFVSAFMQDERKGWHMLSKHAAIIFGLTEKEMGIIIKIVKSWQNQYYNKSQN